MNSFKKGSFMSQASLLDLMHISGYLGSRICHDLMSPISAINNAFELLDEGESPQEILDLIRLSAQSASAKLQLARIAFGAMGSQDNFLPNTEVEEVAKNYMGLEKSKLFWHVEPESLSKLQAKLLLNFLLIANGCVPRGGEIFVKSCVAENKLGFLIEAKGERLRLMPQFSALQDKDFSKELHVDTIDVHAFQPYYSLLLVQISGMKLTTKAEEEKIAFFLQA